MAYTDIDKPSDYFNTKLYTGTGSSQSITGVGFQPDWVWIKNRSGTDWHILTDAVRGATKELYSNATNLEDTNSNQLTSFNSDGFSIGGASETGRNSANFASWNWKAGTSFTNDASGTGIGSIDSAGSFNNDSGFSIVSYTGTGSAGTIKHGLNSVPSMIIIKVLTNTANDWCVYHQATGNNKSTFLNGTNAVSSNAFMNNTTPTSSVFSVDGSNYSSGSSRNYIAYCFSDVKGYSKFGSYTGNNNSNGKFIYLGFKPAFFICKNYQDAGDNWILHDNKRDTFNVTDNGLAPNSNTAEFTDVDMDFLSNGVKMRNVTGRANSAKTFIYMAFSEESFVSSTGVPATAR